MVTRLIVGALSGLNCPGPNFGASPPLLQLLNNGYDAENIYFAEQVYLYKYGFIIIIIISKYNLFCR